MTDAATPEPRTKWDNPEDEPAAHRGGHHYPRPAIAIAGFLGGGRTAACEECGIPLTLRDGGWKP